jgi:hypothetical protein
MTEDVGLTISSPTMSGVKGNWSLKIISRKEAQFWAWGTLNQSVEQEKDQLV